MCRKEFSHININSRRRSQDQKKALKKIFHISSKISQVKIFCRIVDYSKSHPHNFDEYTHTQGYCSIHMEKKHVSEELAEWQQVLSPFPTVPSVFPPRNHEDLQVSDAVDNHPQLQEQEPIHTPSPSGGGDGVRRWMIALQIEVSRIFGRLRSCVASKVGVWSLAWIAGGVAAAFLVSFWRRRVLIRWQRQLDSSNRSLMALLDEKDKKINQLLLQIAEMNDMLLARRRIPVIRVK